MTNSGTIRRFRSVGDVGTGGGAMATSGAFVYPLPADTTVIWVTTPNDTWASALAPVPPPPIKATAGGPPYPEPPEVTMTPVNEPPTTVSTAVAACWASASKHHPKMIASGIKQYIRAARLTCWDRLRQ